MTHSLGQTHHDETLYTVGESAGILRNNSQWMGILREHHLQHVTTLGKRTAGEEIAETLLYDDVVHPIYV